LDLASGQGPPLPGHPRESRKPSASGLFARQARDTRPYRTSFRGAVMAVED